MISPEYIDAFWSKVDIGEPDQCWDWKARTGATGYGYVGIQGKPYRAHRLAWELVNGEIPEGLWVLHKCDNPSCVNPDHLFLGTAKDNTHDMHAKGRAKPPRWYQLPQAKLTMELARALRADYATGEYTLQSVGEKYGISQTGAWKVVKGLVYAEEGRV